MVDVEIFKVIGFRLFFSVGENEGKQMNPGVAIPPALKIGNTMMSIEE